jgi:polar amino acid transport system ATP-binding protein
MISIRHLEKSFEGVTPLKDVNAEINKGDVISVIGPSGTGKSTLLRCINLLETPTKGQVIVDGVDLTDKKTDLRKMRRKIGMVFQSFNLFSHKMVIENVMMAPMDLLGVSRKQAFDDGVKYLKAVGLGERIYAYPDELSGGQKQRVAIARCLAMKPEIILFDEPTSALDPTMTGEVQAVIRKLAEDGLTMMVVTHDMKFSKEIANRIFYMDEGCLYEEGTPEEIFDNPKREKTRAFVKRLHTMEFQIHSEDFDIYALNGKIEEFGRNQFLTAKQINRLQLIIEEVVINSILKKTNDIEIQISYFEVDNKLAIRFIYGGDSFNPFKTDDEDVLSMLVVKQLTSGARHEFKEKNILDIDLADSAQ